VVVVLTVFAAQQFERFAAETKTYQILSHFTPNLHALHLPANQRP
jgi:hypothetical protein